MERVAAGGLLIDWFEQNFEHVWRLWPNFEILKAGVREAVLPYQ